MQYSYERNMAALNDLHDLALAATDGFHWLKPLALGTLAAFATSGKGRLLLCLFTGDHTLHRVTVQGTPGLGSLYEYVVVSIPFNNHEDVTVPGHLDPSGHLLEPFLPDLL